MRLFRPNPNSIFKTSGIPESPTFNPGLGEIVKSKAHLKELCKIKGVEPIGNEKPESLHKYYDKQREDAREKQWSEPDGWVGNGDS